MTTPTLCIVCPCYNEQDVLPITVPLFLDEIDGLVHQGKISEESMLLLVNDGSKDETWRIIRDWSRRDARVQGISLARNRGHQPALLAGLMEARKHADIAVSIDCDGQDDIAAMEHMVDAYLDGCDIVYGVRSDRSSDSLFKRSTAELFYRFLNVMGVECVFNHADYRLMSRRALDALSEYGEANLFLRGIVPLIGLHSTCVEYVRHERIAGQSHYPLKKMLALALDGITSFSIKPIRLITAFGCIASVLSFIGVIWAFASAVVGKTVSGWASLACIVCFMGGIQLLSLGVIGEYVGKTYLEAKRRPRYFVGEKTEGLRRSEDPSADSGEAGDGQAGGSAR